MASLDELEVLSRHLAGELDAAESRRVEELLASRPDLADALALLRGLDAAAPALPATLSEAGAAALVGRVRRPRRLRPALLAAGAAACAALLLGGAWLAWSGARSHEPAGEIVALAGEVTAGDRPVAPLAAQPLQAAGEVRTGPAGSALVRLRETSLLLRRRSRVTFAPPGRGPDAELLQGTLLASSPAFAVAASGSQVRLAGRAAVSLEPFQDVVRVTAAGDDGLASGEDTMRAWTKVAPAVAGAAAGSLLTVMVLDGRAEVAARDGAKIPVAAGQWWRTGDASASPIPAAVEASAISRRTVALAAAPEPPPQPSAGLAAPPRPLPEFEEFEALQQRVKELEEQIDTERKLRAQSEGKPTERPADLPERFSGDRLRAVITAGLKELGWRSEVTSIDCTEYPCIVYGEGSLRKSEWEKLAATGAFAEYKGDSHLAWGWTDGEKKRFGIVLQPKGSGPADPEAHKRLQYRVEQMKEAQ